MTSCGESGVAIRTRRRADEMHDAEHRRESTGHERRFSYDVGGVEREADKINTEELKKLKGGRDTSTRGTR